MPFDALLSPQRSTALMVSSVPLSETIIVGLPQTATMVSSSRITRWPDSEKSGTATMHSLLKSAITFRIRNRRPLANWSLTKSSDQRWFNSRGTTIGARAPMARRRPRRRLADHQYRLGNVVLVALGVFLRGRGCRPGKGA